MVNVMQQINFPSQLNVFIKSIISHPFLKHFNEMILSTKHYHPVTWSEAVTVVGQVWGWGEGKGRERKSDDDTAQFFLFGPIPAKVKKSLVFFQSINFLWNLQTGIFP